MSGFINKRRVSRSLACVVATAGACTATLAVSGQPAQAAGLPASVSAGLASATTPDYAPVLQERSRNGAVFLTVETDPQFAGMPVYFFARNAGRVFSMGMSRVNPAGIAVRDFSAMQGAPLNMYAKVLGAPSDMLPDPYSNTVSFHVL